MPGRGDLAAAITAMPTYAKSTIVAGTKMRTFGVYDEAIAAQENALKADMQSPIVVLSAKQSKTRNLNRRGFQPLVSVDSFASLFASTGRAQLTHPLHSP